MKKVLFLVMMLSGSLMMWAQQRTVVLDAPGTLASKLPQGERAAVTSLKVSGPLNGSDVLVLREMAKAHLAEIDMSDASIVEGGSCYFPVGSDQDAYTQADRFSTRFSLYYNNSRRIMLRTNFALTYTKKNMNLH